MNHQSLTQFAANLGSSSILNRRQMLRNCTHGFGMLALAEMFATESRAAKNAAGPDLKALNPLSVKTPHFAPKAKRIIFLFMPDGPSHTDLFDQKVKSAEYNGKPLPF